MAYDDDGRLVPFINVKGATRRREMEQFLRAAGQTRFEREWPQRPKDVVICHRAALFSAAAVRMSAALRERGFAASHDDLILVLEEHWEAPLQKAIGTTCLVVLLLDLGNMASRLTSPSEAPLAKEITWALENRRPVLAVNVFSYEGEGAALAVEMLDAMFALIARRSETSFASIEVKATGADATSIPDEYVANQIVAAFSSNPAAVRPTARAPQQSW